MVELYERLIEFLSSKDLIPPEVTSTGKDREGTYIIVLPPQPDDAVSINIYDCAHHTLYHKNVVKARVQIVCRNKSSKKALEQISKVYNFLLRCNETEEDAILHLDDTEKFFSIFDLKKGPELIEVDKEGRYLWAISFPLTTNLY